MAQKNCSSFTVEQLNELVDTLLPAFSTDLNKVYQKNDDKRAWQHDPMDRWHEAALLRRRPEVHDQIVSSARTTSNKRNLECDICPHTSHAECALFLPSLTA